MFSDVIVTVIINYRLSPAAVCQTGQSSNAAIYN